MDSIDIYAWITQIITLYSLIVSLPLYILVIVSIWKKRKTPPYDSSFFLIFIALGILDIICWILYVCKKFIFWEWYWFLEIFKPFNQPNTCAQIFEFLLWFFGYMQLQVTLLMQFNRYVCMLIPKLYSKLGTRKVTVIFSILILLLCSAICMPIFFSDDMIIETDLDMNGHETGTFHHYGPRLLAGTTITFYYWIWKIHIYLIVGTGLACYPLIIRKVYISRKVLNQSHQDKQEIKIFYCACILFLVNLVVLGYFIFRDYVLILFPNMSAAIEWSVYTSSDIYDLYNAYSILITAKDIRESVKRAIKLRGFSNAQIAPRIQTNAQ